MSFIRVLPFLLAFTCAVNTAAAARWVWTVDGDIVHPTCLVALLNYGKDLLVNGEPVMRYERDTNTISDLVTGAEFTGPETIEFLPQPLPEWAEVVTTSKMAEYGLPSLETLYHNGDYCDEKLSS